MMIEKERRVRLMNISPDQQGNNTSFIQETFREC